MIYLIAHRNRDGGLEPLGFSPLPTTEIEAEALFIGEQADICLALDMDAGTCRDVTRWIAAGPDRQLAEDAAQEALIRGVGGRRAG